MQSLAPARVQNSKFLFKIPIRIGILNKRCAQSTKNNYIQIHGSVLIKDLEKWRAQRCAPNKKNTAR